MQQQIDELRGRVTDLETTINVLYRREIDAVRADAHHSAHVVDYITGMTQNNDSKCSSGEIVPVPLGQFACFTCDRAVSQERIEACGHLDCPWLTSLDSHDE